jgi:divinyl chlorophyllide a 8-vinyl-reductase
MVFIYSFLIVLATSLSSFSFVESFAPVRSFAPSDRLSTAVHAFNFPDFFSALTNAPNNKNTKSKKTTVIAGATGYIGKSTVRESVRQGYNTIALVRDLEKVESPEGKALYGQFFEGAKVIECDVCDVEGLTKVRMEVACLQAQGEMDGCRL